MRDHPFHNAKILAGMWGIKLTNPPIRRAYINSFKKLLKDPLVVSQREKYDPDQTALAKYFW